jgi:hypothetical protein
MKINPRSIVAVDISVVTEPLPSHQQFFLVGFRGYETLPVAWQRPGWNIHISSDISALWAECHNNRYIKTRTYSNATLCQNFKAIGEELSEI